MNTKNVLRKAGYLGLSASFALALQSCDNDDDAQDTVNNGTTTITDTVTTTDTVTVESSVLISSDITEDATWTADKVWQLGGTIIVRDGVTLTIEPGTVIKGMPGTGANATSLLIARGGKIMAEGTADEPIIFTSIADEITHEDIHAGNFASPNLPSDANSLWGGVIICGKAPISASNDADADITEIQIEGIPTSELGGLYGGSDAADNSGVLSYVSIRHGGSNIGAGNEINGLSLGGVGSGTTISNIEIVGNQDDGIEWYGGTVECTNMITWNVGDDGLDTDMSWGGSLDNFAVITAAGHSFELDGPEGSMEDDHTFSNGTVVASEGDLKCKDLVNVDDNSRVTLENVHIQDVVDGQTLWLGKGGAPEAVTFTNVTVDVTNLDGMFKMKDEELSTDEEDVKKDAPAPTGVATGGSSQVDASVFGWTWANEAGKLSGL